MEDAEAAVEEELAKLKNGLVADAELQKVKNKTESALAFEDMSIMNRANSLAFYELLGDAQLMNKELDKYNEITAEDIQQYTRAIFTDNNSSTLHYYSKA